MFLQLHGIIMISEIIRKRQEQAVCAMILRKRSYSLNKLKRLKQRPLCRRKRSNWFKPGCTDLWWQNIGISPEGCWRKNFRLSGKSSTNY